MLVHLLAAAARVRGLAVRAGADLPDGPCVLSSREFTTMTPVERRADAIGRISRRRSSARAPTRR